MALKSWKQIVYDVAAAVKTLLGDSNSIKVGELAGKISGIPKKAASAYTPTEQQQVISKGQYLSGDQTINPVQTEEKTVTAGTSMKSVLNSAGKYITRVDVYPTPSQQKTVSPTAAGMTIYPDINMLLSGVKLNGEPNAIAANIKKGISILGVLGELESGFDLLGFFNCTKMAIDKFTLASAEYICDVNPTHSLGVPPKVCIIVPNELNLSNFNNWECFSIFGYDPLGDTTGEYFSLCMYDNEESTMNIAFIRMNTTFVSLDEDYSSSLYRAGTEYIMLTMA